MGRILAIDYGRKRTGLAVTDTLRITANPLLTVPTNELLIWLADYFRREPVDEVVIGHPTQLNGQDSESMTYIRPFINNFKKAFPDIKLTEFDERFTSTIAHRAMIVGGMPKMKRQDKSVVDKLAACIILEDYLSTIY